MVLAVFIAGTTFGLDAATAAPADPSQARAIPHGGDFGVRAKSSYEQAFNPFGDDWSAKAAPNTSIPVGLTPACYKKAPKLLLPVDQPSQEEINFLARSNTPLVWEECADVMDASGPDLAGNIGDPRIKANIAALKAANPSLKYIGYLALARADTHVADGTAGPIGLNYIHRYREDWFVHKKDTDPTNPANRLKYIQAPSHLYDVTKPDFRAFMVQRAVESLDHQGMDGFVLDQCFDRPEYRQEPGNVPPTDVVANWEQGCLSLLQELKDALEPRGKRIFFTGYRHIGSEGLPGAGPELGAQAFYEARINVSHGFYWEDPFRAALPSIDNNNAYFSTERVLRLRKYAIDRGRHFVTIVNPFSEGQSTYPSSHEVQSHLARYFLTGFLMQTATQTDPGGFGPLTAMHHYMPIQAGPQFYSTANFRDWDIPLGAPLGDPTRPPDPVDADGDPIPVPIYLREFQGGRVVFNASTSPYTVDLSDGQWRRTKGGNTDPAPSSFTVAPKSGEIFLRVGGNTPTPPVSCSPRPPVNVSVTSLGGGRVQAVLSASSGGGAISRVQVLETRNATVSVEGGRSNASGGFSHTPDTGATTVRLILTRSGPGAMTVPLIVTDACGEWRTFVGAGAG